ncbi:DUF5685 family protein [Nakamurella sp.]|uniref:DUF5685 family protein n=1 Tax=Nakamurella sp. TaxID=1869182 RepID=UPI003B3B9361
MFGVVHACRHTLDDDLFAQWQAHLCGLCLELRDSRGQLARALTNTDAIALSVLTEAQQVRPAARRTAGPCALRGMRTAQVLPSGSAPTRLGATASLTLAAAKAQDLRAEHAHHLGLPTWRTRAGSALAEPLRRRALADAPMARALHAPDALDRLARQGEVEAAVRPGDPVLLVTEPTAEATAAIFAASAAVAGRAENEPALRELGAAFGTLAHLLDAVTDLDDDRRTGSFNPITATGTPLEQVRRECRRLVHRIRRAFDRLTLTDGRLARALLVDGTHAALHRAFEPGTATCRTDLRAAATAGAPGGGQPGGAPPDPTAPGPADPYGPGPAGPRWPGAPDSLPDKPPVEPPQPPKPPFWPNLLPWIAVYCTGYACCASHENPCTGKQHAAGCSGCDGSCCDCADCCNCCDGDCCCDCGCN